MKLSEDQRHHLKKRIRIDLGFMKKTVKKAVSVLMVALAFQQLGAQPTLKFTHLTVEDGLSQANISDILQDKLGFMWIGTEDGLNRYDGYSFKVFTNDVRNKYSISTNHVRCIAEDP